MNIDIVGEDPVTQAIIKRLLKDYRQEITIDNVQPVRGGQIKDHAFRYNRLSKCVFLLTDLDQNQCPPLLINEWLKGDLKRNDFLFRVAQEEAETWLMADRIGFSKWLKTDVQLIPYPKQLDKRKVEILEITFPIKPSLFMMLNIATTSLDSDLRDKLVPVRGAKKGPAYNSALLPFIEKVWNVEEARKNSYSLNKAILRLEQLVCI